MFSKLLQFPVKSEMFTTKVGDLNKSVTIILGTVNIS